MSITREFIIEGIVESFLTARSRQRDAISLYSNKQFPAAYIIATVAAEHVGRAMWLMRQWGKLTQNPHFSIDANTFKKQLKDRGHVALLTDGRLSVSYKLPELLAKKFDRVNDDPELKRQLDEFNDQQWKRAPHKYHNTRERAQYVNPSAAGQSWCSPQEITSDETYDFINDVGNNVNLLRLRLRSPELAAIVEAKGKMDEVTASADIWPRTRV
jgi:AbiV family abortive infection protein